MPYTASLIQNFYEKKIEGMCVCVSMYVIYTKWNIGINSPLTKGSFFYTRMDFFVVVDYIYLHQLALQLAKHRQFISFHFFSMFFFCFGKFLPIFFPETNKQTNKNPGNKFRNQPRFFFSDQLYDANQYEEEEKSYHNIINGNQYFSL